MFLCFELFFNFELTENGSQQTIPSINELVQLGDTEIDSNVFAWRLRKNMPFEFPESEILDGVETLQEYRRGDSSEDRTYDDRTDFMDRKDSQSKTKKLVKLKNLDKELRFITEGYFDFDEMIWKDRIDGRALGQDEWYQSDSFYLR